MVNRMKCMLNSLISENQTTFVPKRLIHDNIIIAHECFHHLKRKKKGKEGEFGLKIDMNKAYDRVEWDFLEEVMNKMGFNGTWINWIMQCIKTVKYTILVSGKEIGEVKPGRGLRQVDPLSPYLFLFTSDVFSRMISKAVSSKGLKGIKLAKNCPDISHLFFADDSLFYMIANEKNCKMLVNIMEDYCRASGQKVSWSKSTLYFSPNTGKEAKERVCGILSVEEAKDPGKYLGLPSIWGRSKVEALGYVKDRVRAKLKGWKSEVLSTAGREILIKAVATSLPAYPMSIFKFPKRTCNEINSIIAGFWCGQNKEEKKIHWQKWSDLTKGKMEGGMGFRDIERFNQALLAKNV